MTADNPNPLFEDIATDRLAALHDPARTPDCPPDHDLFNTAMKLTTPPVSNRVTAHLATGCRHCGSKWEAYALCLGQKPVVRGTVTDPMRETFRKPEPVTPVPDGGASEQTALGQSQATGVSWTSLARQRDVTRLRELLRPRLPGLLARVRLLEAGDDQAVRESTVERFLAYAIARVEQMEPTRRFTEELPNWLEEFAATAGRADRYVPLPPLTPEYLQRLATEDVLGRPQRLANDPVMNSVRDAAIRSRANTPAAVLALPKPDNADTAEWQAATSDLYLEIQREVAIWTGA